VELKIVPDPPEPVRRALVAALSEASSADSSASRSGSSAWWRAGVAESVEDESD
jgi:hypothetical protein